MREMGEPVLEAGFPLTGCALLHTQVQDLFEATGNDQLKLLVLDSGEDDELLWRAAAGGGLAMLTSTQPLLCSHIPEVISEAHLGVEEFPCLPFLGSDLYSHRPPLADLTLAGDPVGPSAEAQP